MDGFFTLLLVSVAVNTGGLISTLVEEVIEVISSLLCLCEDDCEHLLTVFEELAELANLEYIETFYEISDLPFSVSWTYSNL